MDQQELSFNPRPRPDELFKPGTQCHELYSWLLQRPVTSRIIIEEMNIFKYTSRISDIREALKPYLIRVEARRIQSGLFEYSLKDGQEERAAA